MEWLDIEGLADDLMRDVTIQEWSTGSIKVPDTTPVKDDDLNSPTPVKDDDLNNPTSVKVGGLINIGSNCEIEQNDTQPIKTDGMPTTDHNQVVADDLIIPNGARDMVEDLFLGARRKPVQHSNGPTARTPTHRGTSPWTAHTSPKGSYPPHRVHP